MVFLRFESKTLIHPNELTFLSFFSPKTFSCMKLKLFRTQTMLCVSTCNNFPTLRLERKKLNYFVNSFTSFRFLWLLCSVFFQQMLSETIRLHKRKVLYSSSGRAGVCVGLLVLGNRCERTFQPCVIVFESFIYTVKCIHRRQRLTTSFCNILT